MPQFWELHLLSNYVLSDEHSALAKDCDDLIMIRLRSLVGRNPTNSALEIAMKTDPILISLLSVIRDIKSKSRKK